MLGFRVQPDSGPRLAGCSDPQEQIGTSLGPTGGEDMGGTLSTGTQQRQSQER